MVVCRFFINGNCRFGNRCHNEHFDLKQMIVSEVEAALKGTQWPLSGFGPFKEKPCLSNFIDDQSFEEVRYMAYEARNQNCFPTYAQQFNQQILDAQNKMKALLSLSREVIEVVANNYDGGENQQPNSAPSQATSTKPGGNPFALATGSNQNTFGGGGIFSEANAQPAQTTPSGGSIFGGSSFNATPATGGNVFGNNQQPIGALKQSSFGSSFASATTPQQASIFGSQAQTPANPFGSSFGRNISTASSGGNIFGNSQMQSNSSVFGQQIQQTPQKPNTFGGSNMFNQQQQQPQQQQQTNIFGQQQQQQPSVFNNLNQQQQPQNSFFGQTAVVAPTTPFTQPQAFGAINTQIQQPVGVFGQSQPNQFAALQQPQIHQQSLPQQQQQLGIQPQSQQQIPSQNDTLYSRMEDLSPDDLAAFKAEKFEPGKIPFMPPPRELC